LHKLAQRFEGDKSIINSIEELLDEPVSLSQKIKARELNKKGITLFEEGQLEQAIETFKKALNETPKHPALNLNLVQVALKSMKQQASAQVNIPFLEETLDHVKHIPTQHRQYKRFITLSKKVADLKSS